MTLYRNYDIILSVLQMEKSKINQIKSKNRVREHGEVFTAEREVKAMCDLVKDETERIDSRFLEPTCGDGNFLAEILTRKLAVVRKKYGKSPLDYEKNAVLAASSIYGVDILQDNVDACRKRIFEIWNTEYSAICKKECNEQTRDAVRFILSRNTDEPIVFSEWSFIMGSSMQQCDYTFEILLAGSIPANEPKFIFQDKNHLAKNISTFTLWRKPINISYFSLSCN